MTDQALAATALATACGHCGRTLASDAEHGFCCQGCAGAHALIVGLGLGGFYRRREPGSELAPPEPERQIDLARAVRLTADGIARVELSIDGLTCGACVWLIESVLARQPDLLEGRVNLTTRRLALAWRGAPERVNALVRLVAALGYRLSPRPARTDAPAERAEQQALLRALAVAGFAAANIMLLSVSVWSGHATGMGPATRDLMHWLSALIALPAVAYSIRPFLYSALAALRHGRTNMDVPITIGVTIATGLSLAETIGSGPHAYFDSAVTLLFFLLVGRYLDRRARGLARSAAAHLLALDATSVTMLRADGTLEARAPADVPVGGMVLVAAGERIGVDGRIADGTSDIDTSLVTGESMPVAIAPGGAVHAGTINLTAPLRVTVTATGADTLLAEIARLTAAAEQQRSRRAVLADRVARYYAPAVHTLALATFLGWYFLAGADAHQALITAVAVLIVTCPCALALAVPAVQVAACGRLLRQGILLKSATALERLAEIDLVALDKTGTLTEGRLELRRDGNWTERDLAEAAELARASRHPLARALAAAAGPGPVATDIREAPGAGLSSRTRRLGSRNFCGVRDDDVAAGPEIWFARPEVPAVRFAFADRLRVDAAPTLDRLRAEGFAIALLSGDRETSVAATARTVDIADWRASLAPDGKCAELARRAAAGRHVLMVGDGINDAPALAAAHVSMSPASAADIAQVAADVVFQGAKLAPVAEVLAVARQARRLVAQNLGFALAYNLLAVPIAMLGGLTPLIAAAAMSSSSLVVILNALRLGRRSGGVAS
jgi:Cu2+-exporting ATPase